MADRASKERNRAVKAWTKGHYERALEAYQELAKLEPRNAMHKIRVGDCLAKLGRNPEAIAMYKQVATKFAADGMLIRAISVAKLILQLDPDETETQKQLAALYSKRGMATVAQKAKAAARAGVKKEVVVEEVTTHQPAEPIEVVTPDAPKTPAVEEPEEPPPAELTGSGAQEVRSGDGDWEPPDQLENPLVAGTPLPPEVTDEMPELEISVDDAVVEETVRAAVDKAKADMSESYDADLEALFDDMGDLPSVPPTPLFSELEPEEFEKVIEMLMPIRLPEGTPVCREGERAASMYVIAFGRVRVTTIDTDGERIVLAELADGDFFGEAALFEGGVRKATVETIEETELLELSKDSFNTLVEQYPAAAGVLRMFYYSRMADTYLAKSILFGSLTREERWAVVGSMTLQRFPAGYPVINEGETGDALFLIRSGQVRVFSGDGDEMVVLGNLSAGDIFGEIAVVNLQPRTATVVATHDTEVFRLDREAARRVLALNPEIARKIKTIAEERIRNTIDAMITSSAE